MAGINFNTTRNPISGKRERLTVSTTPVGITSSILQIDETNTRPKRLATAAVLEVKAAGIYYTLEGSTPSSTVGFEATTGDYIYLDSYQKAKGFKAIRTGASDVGVEVLPLFGD